MKAPREIAKPVAYWIVATGCVVALLSAFAPMPTGAYWLSGGFLLLGITPYIVYGSITQIVGCCPLLGAGIALLAVDLAARLAGIVYTAHAGLMPAVYLCLALLLLVIPAGVAVGALAAKIRR